MNLSKMDNKQLNELKDKLDFEFRKREAKKRVTPKDMFYAEQSIKFDYELKIEMIKSELKDFERTTNISQQIEDLGYSIVRYDDKRFGFIDFKKEPIDDNFIGFDYSLDAGFTHKFGEGIEEDFEILKQILDED